MRRIQIVVLMCCLIWGIPHLGGAVEPILCLGYLFVYVSRAYMEMRYV